MTEIQDQIEDARRRVAICQRRAERPGARVEDELALQSARNRLLTLELRVLQRIVALQKKFGKGPGGPLAAPEPAERKKHRRMLPYMRWGFTYLEVKR
ncbi:hypothetical protein [Roseibium aggregatum]|uniref:Uncharacterized protein n=1 Tax=Roseibium aggregatum TaxID=187304 RepID=A0A926NW38_9HYPH|nr:hypothetical protein [Roseibium aggregatum]MBD1544878.1 hypothetical protein [Roseibium aggregatum]